MDTNITVRMKNANLTAMERKAIEILLNDLGKTVFLSGTQMAELCGVSAASMTRIAQKLGYEKLSNFKEELNELYKKSVSSPEMFQDFMSGKEMNETAKRTISNDLANIAMMEKMLDKDALEEAACAIANTRKVYVIGMFSSEVVVRAFCHYLWRLGINYSEFMGVGLSKRIEYSDMQPGDVLIAISSQRVFKEIVDSVETAKAHGLTTIAITDNYTNPLACLSDNVFIAPVKGYALDCTHAATLVLVNVIANIVAAKNPEKVARILKEEANKCNSKELFCI